jgi:ubiquitin C-terminal hydrolase
VNNDTAVIPTELRAIVQNIIPKFNNTMQQDSHEFLVYLLDLLHEDLNRSTILSNHPNFNENILPKLDTESDISASKRFWNYHKERNNSIIVDLFHGQMKNEITCLSCSQKTVTFEPFMTLPLAIPVIKRVDVIIVPAIDIKSTIKLSLYVSEAAMFVDMWIYLKQYITLKERFRYILVNSQTHTARFIKHSENISIMSKKGHIFCYEIDEELDDDNYPFIALIKNEELKNQEVLPSNTNEESSNINIEIKNNEVPNPKLKSSIIFDNFSYPRLFPINSYEQLKELRQNIYGFLRKYYPPPESICAKYKNIVAEYQEAKYIDESEYKNIIKEEYAMIFYKNYQNRTKEKDFIIDNYLNYFPFNVMLVSLKDENKTKNLFSANPKEFNEVFAESLNVEKIIDIVKSGYKLIIEVKKFEIPKENYENLKTSMNSIISIKNKDEENSFTKSPNLYDCLDHFRLTEKLEKGNDWYCNECKKIQNAFKKTEIFYAPKYLIVILKRYESKFLGKSKIQILKNNTFVKYAINNLNLYEMVVGVKDPKPIYDLFSVSQHSGSTEGGHYATACRNFGKWYEIDDSKVFPSEDDLIVSPEGYILFYRRNEKR